MNIRVYNAGKITKYELLVRMVCEATSGYICNLEVYTTEGKNLIQTITLVLEPYIKLWHHVYMDSYYNSVANTEILLSKKFRTCGTIRVNRGLPTSLKTLQLKKGESRFCRRNDTLLQVWRSKNCARMISNIHSAEICDTNKVDSKTGQIIKNPKCILDYNKFMKGVDRAVFLP